MFTPKAESLFWLLIFTESEWIRVGIYYSAGCSQTCVVLSRIHIVKHVAFILWIPLEKGNFFLRWKIKKSLWFQCYKHVNTILQCNSCILCRRFSYTNSLTIYIFCGEGIRELAFYIWWAEPKKKNIYIYIYKIYIYSILIKCKQKKIYKMIVS